MESLPVQSTALQKRLQVAAIDFGTTFSGYAFTFRTDFEADPLQVRSFNWQTASGCLSSLKTSSSILFSPGVCDKGPQFHSFGFEAEQKYAELAAEEQHTDWYFFRRFKMLLYKQKKLNRKTMLEDDKGLLLSAMTVFTSGIRYLKDHLLENSSGFELQYIHWVLTVPAIWEDSAKQFMREAAVAAGIQSENLSLALEPEAASLYCRHLPLNRLHGADGSTFSCFEPGTRYLVLDAGGGTVDITVHETQADGDVKEIYKANGGPWGGTTVDDAFRSFLVDILGNDVIDDVTNTRKDDCLDLFREFEIKKRTFGTQFDKVTFKLPISFFESFQARNGHELSTSDIKENLRGSVKLSRDKVRVDAEAIRGFFQPTCDHIVSHLQQIFQRSATNNTDVILMVGGFSESVFLQQAIRDAFPGKRIIVPEEAGLAVVKGAVIFGHNPSAITARVARRTYGVSTYKRFNPSIHPRERMTIVHRRERCPGCFDKHVQIGQVVKVGEAFETKTYFPLYRNQKRVSFKIYTSKEKNPIFADSPPCNLLGKIDVDLSSISSDADKSMIVKMIYGEPELRVEVRVPTTGDHLKARFDFLE